MRDNPAYVVVEKISFGALRKLKLNKFRKSRFSDPNPTPTPFFKSFYPFRYKRASLSKRIIFWIFSRFLFKHFSRFFSKKFRFFFSKFFRDFLQIFFSNFFGTNRVSQTVGYFDQGESPDRRVDSTLSLLPKSPSKNCGNAGSQCPPSTPLWQLFA